MAVKKQTKVPGYTPSKSGSTSPLGTGVTGVNVPAYGSASSSAPKFIGGGSGVEISKPGPSQWGLQNQLFPGAGYVKGDEVKLLPNNADDLRTLQLSLIQAGYITDAQAKMMVLGSPDQVTSSAFAKLLATANYTGTEWKSALSTRLATIAQDPSSVVGSGSSKVSTPPLTISLTNPEDIKAVVQKTAQSLLGGYLPDDQVNSFVANYQAQERAYQTQQYNQQYNPGVGYGPGGEAVAAPTQTGLAQQTEDTLKATQPEQYGATQFGAQVSDALSKLRTTGYL